MLAGDSSDSPTSPSPSGSEDDSRSQGRHGYRQVVVEDLIVCLLCEHMLRRCQLHYTVVIFSL